jgi:undecaprenyl-diphosphatase
MSLDERLLVFARTRGHSAGLERAIGAYSRLGEHGACWIALGLGGAALSGDSERRAAWLRGVQTVVVAYGLNYAVKLAVRRKRPELPGLPPLTKTVSSLSLPSAHATTSFAGVGVYRRLVPAAPLYAAAFAFALSRPYLGVHYPSDVVAGAVLGTTIARLSTQ